MIDVFYFYYFAFPIDGQKGEANYGNPIGFGCKYHWPQLLCGPVLCK